MVSTSQGLEGAGRQFHGPANETVRDRTLLHLGGKDTRQKPYVGTEEEGGDQKLGTDGSLGKMRYPQLSKTPKSVAVELCPDLTSRGTGLSLNRHIFPPST